MVSEVMLRRVDDALHRCQLVLDKHYHGNEHGNGWYHRLSSDRPGPTATALGLHFLQLRGVRFRHRDAALAFLARRQVASGGWAINTSVGLPVVEATAWVTRFLGATGAATIRGAAAVPDVGAACAWLRDNQNDDGGWGSFRGEPSRVYLTALALRALLSVQPDGGASAERGAEWLLAARASEGAWGVTVSASPTLIHTAMAVLALAQGTQRRHDDLVGGYAWLRAAYDPDRLVDERSRVESYNATATVAGEPVTWHNSLPHYSAPFVLQALLTDADRRVDETVLRGMNTLLATQNESGHWPNIDGGTEPSMWCLFPFGEALHAFRANPLLAGPGTVRAAGSVVLVSDADTPAKDLARVLGPSRWQRLRRVARRQWATATVAVFLVVGGALAALHVIAVRDFLLSLVFPVVLLFAQEIAHRTGDSRPR